MAKFLDYTGLQRFKTKLDAQTNGLIAPVYDSTKTYDVGDYVIYNNDLYRCTTAITTAEAWTAAHWTQVALGDDVADLKSAISYGTYYKNMLLTESNTINTIVGTNNIWTVGSSFYSYIIRRPSKAKSIRIKGNADRGSVVSMLKTWDHVGGTNVVYATGTRRTFITATTEQTLALPDDCQYVNIMKTADSAEWVPEIAEFVFDGIDGIDGGEYNGEIAWYDSYSVIAHGLSSGTYYSGKLSAATNVLSASDYISIDSDGNKLLEVTMIWVSDATFPAYGLCLYDGQGNPIKGRAVSAKPKRGANDARYIISKIYLPENAKYFRTTYWSAATISDYPDIPEFSYNVIDIPDEYNPITHELPVDVCMQNAIRRARQLTDIRWTPRVNVPRYSMIDGSNLHFLDWFYADHEYVGIPYSGAGDDETHWSTIKEWGYTHNWVGQHIPIEAFVTAARYPNSIMGEKTSQSQPSYDSSPFGDVCTSLVNYAVDGPTPLRGITNFFTTSDAAFTDLHETVGSINANDVCIGDFLYTSAHVIMITDLMRDKDGNVICVEMSEETTVGNGNNAVLGELYGGVARRKMWDVTEWKSKYSAHEIYRKKGFSGITYTPCRYVDTGNEGHRDNIVDLPCIPYLGNTAVYKVGYIHNSKVCIGATGFTSLIVTKDGEAFGTFDVTGLTEVTVGFTDAGHYEAYLSNGSTQTVPCEWTVEA